MRAGFLHFDVDAPASYVKVRCPPSWKATTNPTFEPAEPDVASSVSVFESLPLEPFPLSATAVAHGSPVSLIGNGLLTHSLALIPPPARSVAEVDRCRAAEPVAGAVAGTVYT